MAEEPNNGVPPEEEDQYLEDTFGARVMDWIRTELVWYAGSFTFHLLLLSILLLLGNFVTGNAPGDVPTIEALSDADKEESTKDKEEKTFEKFEVGDPEEEQPKELDVDPTLERPAQQAQTEEYNDDSATFEHKGGGMANGMKEAGMGGGIGFYGVGSGPKLAGPGGIGVGLGTGKNWGSGGDGVGYGGRGSGHRKAMLARSGGTKHTERAVTAALIWLAHHQLSDGSWSLQKYTERCNDHSCTGNGIIPADAGATAMGLLPFLAAGQTHKAKGYYRNNIANGLNWLIAHQKPDGDLAFGHPQKMYSHGLATIALCEAYGMTSDKKVGLAAQGAVNYILNAQHKTTGGWRYNPGDEGDTSVVGWQIMALKSALMAGLQVGGSSSGQAAFEGGSKWLDSVAVGPNGSNFCYQPGTGPSNTMCAVGLLCRQYLGAKRASPMMVDGVKYLLANLPDPAMSNVYYWYYATQVIHNMAGYEWDTWNRKMRKILVDTQCKDSSKCANGSWEPVRDQWARSGGRVMMTSLCCLTLEIYYRYLPLFKAEAQVADGAAAPAPAKEEPKKEEPKKEDPKKKAE